MSETDRFVFVYLPEYRCSGIVTELGAHASKVKFSQGGVEHHIYISNEEFIERGSIGIEVEDE